jgi:hypothetical protein
MGGWGCPHEFEGKCQKVLNMPCDIGMKGCVLAGRFRFVDESKNRQKKKLSTPAVDPTPSTDDSND